MSAAVSEVITAEIVKADALAPAFAGLEAGSARQLREAFVPALLQIEEWERQASDLTVTDETQTAKMEMAGVMRKALKKVRVGVEKKRKELGADALARTKAINCAAGIVEGLIVPLEKRLLEQETFGERAALARQDKVRAARAETLRALDADPSTFADLGVMSDEAWSATLDSAKLAHEARLEATKHAERIRVEAERLAAEKREEERRVRVKAEAERVERERAAAEENARLRAEAADREVAASVERARVEAERAAERAQAKAESDARDATEAIARAEREAATRAAQAEADRVARELAELKAATEKAAAEREAADVARAAAEADAKKPTKAKYAALVEALNSIAAWGDDLATADEPHAAAKARAALEAVGLGQ